MVDKVPSQAKLEHRLKQQGWFQQVPSKVCPRVEFHRSPASESLRALVKKCRFLGLPNLLTQRVSGSKTQEFTFFLKIYFLFERERGGWEGERERNSS